MPPQEGLLLEILFGSPLEVQDLVPESVYEQGIGTYPYTVRSLPPGGMEHRNCSCLHAELDTWGHTLVEGSFAGGNLEGWIQRV